MPTGIPHRRRVNAMLLPEAALRTPEAAKTEQGHFHTFRKWGLQRTVVNEMGCRHRHGSDATGQRFGGRRQGEHFGSEHGVLLQRACIGTRRETAVEV